MEFPLGYHKTNKIWFASLKSFYMVYKELQCSKRIIVIYSHLVIVSHSPYLLCVYIVPHSN